ncbi:hypothetical protein CDQ84_11035 [Clostridium thermosuccinogenes]|uniref:Uncharacterized protein n=1 Tax=Clostridium thermosuccinogenes TaxID=84032 RepID=A0A2K2FD20_9CLOT|nr:hypothetical protein CDO33_11870 [Pseudoclostridium thermosuccinogenes]PNT92260.1 hypothetical protein CDQ83_01400 [Pseudoclostridium thermosuccinogenes]PNT96685.1 hypothetical protein CDQ85_10880 [Pseudoclostridium thermosuccinogenes]PNT98479.1 hypothetical protein CDQ84_11035 [Pseudoclostridium thermosuccinogenes]
MSPITAFVRTNSWAVQSLCFYTPLSIQLDYPALYIYRMLFNSDVSTGLSIFLLWLFRGHFPSEYL